MNHLRIFWILVRFWVFSLFVLLLVLVIAAHLANMQPPGRPKAQHKYYVHVKFSQKLLAVFAKNGCNYNSAKSWAVYFSRDPHSYTGYTPYGNWQLPHFITMNKVSDLKLFLPQSSYLLNSYRKTKHHDTYPVITTVWPRNYPLSPKEQKLLKQLSQQNTETKIEIIQTNKRRPFSLRQRAKEGPWYLDYSLYVGASQTTRKNKKLVSFVS